MSSIISKLCFFFIVIILFSFCKNDKTTKNENNIETETIDIGNYTIPVELEYSNHDKDNFLYDKFYPVGWSETGLFAYITEVADEGSGYYFFKFSIQNLINDKVEWEWEPVYSEEDNLDSIWIKNYSKIQEKLIEYNVIQSKDLVLNSTTFTYLNKQYNLKIFTETEKNSDYGFDIIKSTKVNLTSPQLGTKTIYDYKEENYSMLLGQIIAGYVQSPFEDRIAVIIKNERWGYEGPPNLIYFTIIGSNLTESFQPDTKK